MRVLAVDPSLRGTGYAILERSGKLLRAIELGVIKNSDKLLPSSCLVAIHDRLSELIHKHEPECAAVEGIIFVQSHRIAITLGAARGVAILAMAGRGLPVYEYAPRRVKQGCSRTWCSCKNPGRLHSAREAGTDGNPAARCSGRPRNRAYSFPGARNSKPRSRRSLTATDLILLADGFLHGKLRPHPTLWTD